ncbi:hypothetical protein SISSUDRAFT_383383 [Sistotremastrum suecicum HHB10207 ss-3]|uniref:NACHT domain-containing protein n=1 Tax=Sistotremastrum suecicum HHB10207 ss-3 TaxID=1314776 RepID=A0A166FU32_9AGAM|nr:hypothetical protein SISSUDRAFT_383383 [Sistotremastrum suecicum HHB10207 ss-3]
MRGVFRLVSSGRRDVEGGRQLRIWNLRAFHFPTKKKYSVEVNPGPASSSTGLAECVSNSSFSWSDSLFIDLPQDTTQLDVTFRIHQKRTIGHWTKPIYEQTQTLSSLSPPNQQSIRVLAFKIPAPDFSPDATMSVTISIVSSMEAARIASQEARDRANQISGHALPSTIDVVDTLSSARDNAQPIYEAVYPFLDKIQAFVEVVDKVSELHPYAKIAWSVMSFGYKVLKNQKETDDDMNSLLDTMDDVYTFLLASEPLHKIEAHKDVARRLIEQTRECGFFIQHYAKDKSLAVRTVKNLSGTVKKNIKSFQDSFQNLKAEFLGTAAINTEIVVIRVWELQQSAFENIVLQDIPFIDASFQTEKQCHPETRTGVIDNIARWANRPISTDGSVPRIFWLRGVAGSGKSAISHSIAHRFDQTKRLGCSFFFPENLENANKKRGPRLTAEYVVRNVVTGLSNLIDQFRKSVVDKATQRELRQTDSITRQFEELFRDPSADVQFVGPFLIVIDGLDKIPTGSTRTTLLGILAKRLGELPPNFRFLISSTPDHDIKEAFDKCGYLQSFDLQSLDSSEALRDVTTYVNSRLAEEIDAGRFTPEDVTALVERTESHFWYAAAACDYILEDAAGGTLYERWTYMKSLDDWNGILKLSQRYRAIFDHIFRLTIDDPRLARYRLIMGRIMTLFDPLDTEGLIALIPKDQFPHALLDFLGPLFIGTFEPSAKLEPFHSSLRTFVLDKGRSKIYHIDKATQHHQLTCATLQAMSARPIANGHPPVDSLDDLRSHLLYACRFWGYHLKETIYDKEVEQELVKWSSTDHNQLRWLRILNHMRKLAEARALVTHMISWDQANTPLMTDHAVVLVSGERLQEFIDHHQINETVLSLPEPIVFPVPIQGIAAAAA